MQNVKNDVGERQLQFSRLLDAPIELVWEVWTDPAQIGIWWGPNGVTNNIKKMNVEPGGDFVVVMHNPDGRKHELEIVFRVIEKCKKIVYAQLNHFRCIATIEFEAVGDKTFIRWIMLFESKEFLIQCAKEYGVDWGLEQSGERLIQYLSKSKNQQI